MGTMKSISKMTIYILPLGKGPLSLNREKESESVYREIVFSTWADHRPWLHLAHVRMDFL